MALWASVVGAQASGDDERVDFQRQIRPLLSDRCFVCHGPDAGSRKSELRLDRSASARADLGGYAAIVAGDVAASELVQRIRSDIDPMPPPESKLELDADEIELFERWIEQGADYEEHWAFVPPEAQPAATAGASRSGWARDPLDRLVLRGIEAAGLQPAPEADRATWLRRVSFVLTGLPPSLEELDAFLASEGDEDAHEREVDRLLRSARYGERMAADWLDAARYADTYGYQNDVARDVWPWRDWVIRAFRDNLPWDEFATWQLAGDLLPEPTRDQQLATTFNRLHRQTNEGGSVEEEFRVEYVSDRVHTFGMAFLGLTLECARCHDHKYDPIRQRDYYGLAAFFDNIDESGLYSHFTNAVPTPALLLSTPEEKARIAELEQAIAELEGQLARMSEVSSATFAAWRDGSDGIAADARKLEGESARFDFESIEEGQLVNAIDADKPGTLHEAPRLSESPAGPWGKALVLSGEDNASFPGSGAFERHDPFTLALRVRIPEADEPLERAVVLHRSRAWTDSGSRGYQLLIEEGRLSASLIHFWPGNALRVRTLDAAPVAAWFHVAVVYDGSSRASGLRLFIDGREAACEVVRDGLTRTILEGGVELTIGQRFRDYGFKGGQVDTLRVFDRALSRAELQHVASGDPLEQVLERRPDLALDDHLARVDPAAAETRAKLRALRTELGQLVDGISEIMTMRELSEPRITRLLKRGSYLRPGEPVSPSTPPAVLAFPPELPANRLGLSRWLFHPDNPLTARVAVNRLWRIVFGRGLVVTAEDFGNQGLPPTNQELLDSLGLAFCDSGWDVKSFLKRLVLSATFRQSSRVPEGVRRADPENRLLARASTLALQSEMVRDQALMLSGLLIERIGGPPVKPYQPAGLWHEKSGQVYKSDDGEGLWRRSLYTHWKRTSPPPSMMILDASKRDVCVARRRSTRTPMRTLLLWNDPQFVEAGRSLAQRVLESDGEDRERLASLWRRSTSRLPSEEERLVLQDLLESAREEYRAKPSEALALLRIGHAALAEGHDPAELAAWSVVANTVLSSDGTVTLR